MSIVTGRLPSRSLGRRFSVPRASDLGLGVIVVTVLLLTLTPIYFLAKGSLLSGRPGQAGVTYTLDPLREVFTTTAYLESLKNSLLFGVLVATLATLLVGTVCWVVARTDIPGRQFLLLIIPASLAVGPIVGAMAWIALLSPGGAGLVNKWAESLIGRDLMSIYTIPGIVLVLTFAFAPFAFLFMYGGLAGLASDQEEAARVHGGTLREVFRRVSLPSARSTLLGGWILIFGMALQNLSVYALIGNRSHIPTIPASMFRVVQSGENVGQANALALMIIIPSLLVLVWHVAYTRRLGTQKLLGRQLGPPGVRLGRWKPVVMVGLGLYLLVFVVLPVGALVLSSFLKFRTADITWELFTFEHYRMIMDTTSVRDALWTTIKLSLTVATLGTSISLITAYIANYRKGVLGAIVGIGPILLLTVPGFALGLGFLWASFSSVAIREWSGTVIGLSVAVMLAYLGYGTRVFGSSLNQFGAAYEEAGVVAGKSTWVRLTRIVTPILLPSVISVWRLLAVLSMLEFNIVALLYEGNTVPLAVFMFGLLDSRPAAGVFALGVCQVVLVMIISFLTLFPGRKVRRYQ